MERYLWIQKLVNDYTTRCTSPEPDSKKKKKIGHSNWFTKDLGKESTLFQG